MRITSKIYLAIALLMSGCSHLAVAQTAPDVIVNGDQQGTVVANNNFANLYSLATNIQNTVTQVTGYFVNGILQNTVGGTGQDSSAWTSGDAVYMSSTGVWGHTPFPASNYHGAQIFTGSGTFTAPTGISVVYLSMVGGGGSGAVASGTSTPGGGGGGQSVFVYPYAVTPLSSYTVTIGAGGNSGGNPGGSTTFDGLTVVGGASGATSAGGIGGGGLNGTSSSGGSFGIQGGNGFGAVTGNGDGGGGGTPFGPGTAGAAGNSSSPTANTGAGSGASHASKGGTSGAGASGIVIVQY